MFPEILFGAALILALFFAFQIFTSNKRLAQLGERAIIEEKDWLDKHAHEFPRMERKDIIAGLRFAGDGFNFEHTMLLPDDSWGTTLAPTTTKQRLDPAIKDWEALAAAKGFSPGSAGSLTMRDFIEYYGPRPEAQAMLEDDETF